MTAVRSPALKVSCAIPNLLISVADEQRFAKQIVANHQDARVDQQMTQPRRPDRPRLLVQPGPEEAADGDAQRQRHHRSPEVTRQVDVQHNDVVRHEGQARQSRRRPERQMLAQAAEDEPAPVIFLQKGVQNRNEGRQADVGRQSRQVELAQFLSNPLRRASEQRAAAQGTEVEDEHAGKHEQAEASRHRQPVETWPARARQTAIAPPQEQQRESELDALANPVGGLLHGVDLPATLGQQQEVEPRQQRRIHQGEEQGWALALHGNSPTTRRTRTRNFFSASLATAMISSSFAGSRASGRHISVTTDRPRMRMPSWTPTMTSGTVDMPTTSAPPPRRKRYSARV